MPGFDSAQETLHAAHPQPSCSGDYQPVPVYRDLPEITDFTTKDYQAAADYLGTILPDVKVEPLSIVGATSVVMHDGVNAYKVRRSAYVNYGALEDEAAILAVGGEAGVTPELVALIDAAPQHRYDGRVRYTRGDGAPLFGGTQPIPRIASEGHLAVTVTKLTPTEPLLELPAQDIAREFTRIAGFALKHQLFYEDAETKYDPASGRAIIMDVGEVHHPSVTPPVRSEHFSDQAMVDAFIVSEALFQFGRHPQEVGLVGMARLLEFGGLKAVLPLIKRYRQTQTQAS